jgi:hypothetical protein
VDLNNDGDYLDGDESAYTDSTTSAGQAAFDVSPPLADATYGFRARVSDAVGNEGTSATATVQVTDAEGWAKGYGQDDASYPVDVGRGVAVDAAGNTYVTGVIACNSDNESEGAAWDNNGGIFVRKYSVLGDLVWERTVGGGGSVEARGRDVEVDEAGNVYVVGFVQGTNVDFGNGHLVSSNGSYDDILIWKLNDAGVTQWAFAIGGATGARDEARGVALDAAGNVYVSGRFKGTADFDPDPGNTVSPSLGGAPGAFVAKYAADGSFVWLHYMVSNQDHIHATSVSVASDGTVHATGSFNGTANFDPGGTDVSKTTGTSYDSYLLKLNQPVGPGDPATVAWVKQVGGASYDSSTSVDVDSTGNAFIAGTYQSELDFDEDSIVDVTASGLKDGFVAKYNASGVFQWGYTLGGPGSDHGLAVAVDPDGTSYTVGGFEATVDFDPSLSGMYLRQSAGDHDVFLLQLDAAGSFVRARDFGGSGDDFGRAIARGPRDDVGVAGSFSDTFFVDTGDGAGGVDQITSSGTATDVFAAKLLIPANPPPQVTSVSPTANTHTATVDTDVSATYDQNVNAATVSADTLVVQAMSTGQLLQPPSTTSAAGTTATLDPAQDFHPGELVHVTATTGIHSDGGDGTAMGHVWQFRTAVSSGTGFFVDSGQQLGSSGSENETVATGDWDNDGDLDALVVNRSGSAYVWTNDGQGNFSST